MCDIVDIRTGKKIKSQRALARIVCRRDKIALEETFARIDVIVPRALAGVIFDLLEKYHLGRA